jgi:hypothetical protein
MIRVVSAALVIYLGALVSALGALVSASSYLPVERVASTTATPLPDAGARDDHAVVLRFVYRDLWPGIDARLFEQPQPPNAASASSSGHGRTDEGAPPASAGRRRTIRPGVVSDSRTPGTFNATYR